jgi:hypothetical protein
MRKTFSIKHLLFLITGIAIVMASIAPVKRTLHDWTHRHLIESWANQGVGIDAGRSLAVPATTVGADGKHRFFEVANGEMEWMALPDGRQGWILPSNPKQKEGFTFFVLPPGKWVKTIDDVLEEWYENKSGHVQFGD